MSMTNKSRINLEPWGQHQLQKIASSFSSVLFLPLPYLALMAPKSDQLSIQSFFGIQGQGRQVVELVKAKRGRPPKPRPAAQPAQEGLATTQQEGRDAAEQEEQAAAEQEEQATAQQEEPPAAQQEEP